MLARPAWHAKAICRGAGHREFVIDARKEPTFYRATKGVGTKKACAEQRATPQEALELNETLAQQLSSKLARTDTFRAKPEGDARRCRELLAELG